MKRKRPSTVVVKVEYDVEEPPAASDEMDTMPSTPTAEVKTEPFPAVTETSSSAVEVKTEPFPAVTETGSSAAVTEKSMMADKSGTSTRRPVFKRYSALEALQEVLNDNDSGDDDFGGLDESDSDDDETDSNQHHPLLSEVEGDEDEDDPNFEMETESDSESDAAELSDHANPSTSPASPPVVRGRGRGRGSGQRQSSSSRGRGGGMGRGARQLDLISEWKVADARPPNADITFTANPGIKCNVDNFGPADYMELFFDDDLMNHLVIQTNLYAHQFLEAHLNLPEFSRANKWEPVDAAEMKKFLALMLLMGIVKLPAIELYWSQKVLYRIPVFSSVMTRNRFQIILQFLHFHDNMKMPLPNDPEYDRLYKIRPVLDHLFEKFQEVYEPRQAVCVDESLLLWKGRLIFRKYIPLKRARFGIKVYQCCESDGMVKESGGYCYRFKVNAGKEDPVNEVQPVLQAVDADNPSMSASEKMVLFLVAPLLNKGYHVYTDNWYSSLRMYLYLLEKKTLACGTVRENRGVPLELHGVKPPPGSSTALCGDGKIVATKYHSTKMVHLLSTVQGHTEAAIPDKRGRGVNKRPQVSTKYNGNMGGVNKQDQLLHPYDCSRKSMKWTKKLFFHFFQVAAVNAFILSKSGDNSSKTFLIFLESVICSWLWPDNVPVVKRNKTDDEVRLTARHFIFPIPATPSKTNPQKACRVCTKKHKIRRDVRYYCPFCPSKPALCFPQCFMDYHTKFVYWQ